MNPCFFLNLLPAFSWVPKNPRGWIFFLLLIFTVPAWVGPAEPQVWSLDSFAAGTPAGKEGVPEGWSLEGRPEAQSKILLSTEERGYLALVGHGDSFGLKKELAFDLRDFPFLSWQWRVVHHPRGGDIRQKAKDDQAGQIYVIFGRFPLFLHYRALGYIWDPAAPVGFSGTSRTYSRMKYQVIRSGAGGLGQWMEESHDVQTDFRKLFQEEPPPVAG